MVESSQGLHSNALYRQVEYPRGKVDAGLRWEADLHTLNHLRLHHDPRSHGRPTPPAHHLTILPVF